MILGRKKAIQFGKEEVKLSLCADDMILCINGIHKNTNRANEKFSKIAGYKIDVQKSVLFLIQ